jgi:site-specific recombinase
MSEAMQGFIHELMRRFHQRVDKADSGIRDLRNETSALRLLIQACQSDINNIYIMMHQHDDRLDRIENRLELRELAEAQARFEPHP